MSIYKNAKEAADFLKTKTSERPLVAVVLGSGLGSFADGLQNSLAIPFEEIPHFHKPTVIGHGGKLVFAKIDGVSILVQQGRVHYYEGHSMSTVAHPARTLGLFGIKTMILTNASGGLRDEMNAGDLMAVKDHINLMGTNPLIGPNIEEFGPRFPDMSVAYDLGVREKIRSAFLKCKVPYQEGVYVGLSGPTFETPAEVQHLRRIGGDAVGMSTVPETIVLRHMGVKVGAISCVTNKAAGLSAELLSHEDVTQTGKKVEATFSSLIKTLLPTL